MSKRSQRRSTNPVSTNPAIVSHNSSHVLLAGIICLLVGLAVGYYFGKESAENRVLPESQVQSGTPAGNSAVSLQEETALKSVLLSDPKNVNALIELGNLYYDHRQFREAIEYYGRALEIEPGNPNVRTDRGTSYWNLGQPDAAISEFRKSLEVDPTHAQTLYNLGLVYLNGKNNQAEARNAWQRLLETNPNYPERAKVEQQLASLPPAGSSFAGDKKEPASDLQGLLERLKKN